MAQFLQEPSKNGAEAVIASAVQMCEFSTRFMALFEYVSESAWPSGRPRQTSTLMMFVEDGLVKLCLHDRALQRSLWVSGDSWESALTGMEVQLSSGKCEWRKDKPGRR